MSNPSIMLSALIRLDSILYFDIVQNSMRLNDNTLLIGYSRQADVFIQIMYSYLL